MVVETTRKCTSRTKVEPPSTKECTLDDRAATFRVRWCIADLRDHRSIHPHTMESKVRPAENFRRSCARWVHLQKNHCPRICRGTCSPWDSPGTPFRQPETGVPSSLLFSPRLSFRTTKKKDGNMVVHWENQDLSSNGACSPRERVHVTHDRGDSPGAMKSNEAACNERTPARV